MADDYLPNFIRILLQKVVNFDKRNSFQNHFLYSLMKNPFLEERSIFTKVQKPVVAAGKKQQRQGLNTNHKKQQEKTNYSSNGDKSLFNKKYQAPGGLGYGGFQKQSANMSHNVTSGVNNKFMSSQKITFGEPSSSEAYHGERTSGYFNLVGGRANPTGMNTKGNNETNYPSHKPYEARENNFFQGQNNKYAKGSFAADRDFRQTMKEQKEYPNYSRASQGNLEYEFMPPPINNFGSIQGPESQYQSFKTTNYQYKAHSNGQQKSYGVAKQAFRKETTSQQYREDQRPGYKSPPEQYSSPVITQKDDVSYRFKQSYSRQFSPIGEVSRHKINEDSLLNIDGLMDGGDLDKLLAQSKMQEELIRILGMDTSAIKRNNHSKRTMEDLKFSQYDNKNQRNQQKNITQDQFVKKNYEQDYPTQKVPQYQQFEQEPQVFNYSQSKPQKPMKQMKVQTNYKQITVQTVQRFSMEQPEPENKLFYLSTKNQHQRENSPENQQICQKEDYDLQKIIQNQMEKYINQQQGLNRSKNRDRRVFMTTSQKIITKKYQLNPL